MAASVGIFDEIDYPIQFAQNRPRTRMPRVKQFLYAWQSLRDVALGACDSAAMERAHSKLCTGFSYRLRGDDSYRCSFTHEFPCCQVDPITVLADSIACLTDKR